MKHRNAIQRLLNIGLISMLAAVSNHALASNFQLFEFNAVNAGDAGAGGAAIAEDASTSFINPAGLTRLKKPQLVISNTFIMAKTKFEGSSTWFLNSSPSTTSYPASGQSKGGASALIPGLFYSTPINPNIAFGFGVSAPFGLATNYSENAFTRYAATLSELAVIDISPSLGFKVNDKLSLGFGVDVEKATATLSSIGGIPGVGGTAFDTRSENEASDWGYGWHAGALYQFTPATRVGLSYRSQVVFHPSGTSTLTGRLANGFFYASPASGSSTVSTDLTLPPMTTLSLYHDVNQRLALMGSANYTQWSTIKAITLHNVLSAKTAANPSGLIDVSLPQNYRNTWRFAVGANYKLCPKWMLRAGVGYDQTPANDTDRSLRLPDADRTLVAIGTRYQVTKMVGLDVGYTHIFVKDASINNTAIAGATTTQTIGKSKSSADFIGGQVTWNLG